MSNIASKIRGEVFRRFKRYFPKKFLVEYYHRKKLGKPINLRDPETYSDKLGWYKLYYRDELMRTCTDKASVREYIAEQGYGSLLNECYGVYEKVEDIDWEALPQQFVLKNTLGGSGKSVLLVYDKASLNVEETKTTLQEWLDKSSYCVSPACEWVYEGRPARIIAEKLLIADSTGDLPDYKFFCFNGKVYCSYYMQNCTTKTSRSEGELGILDRDFHLLPAWRRDFGRLTVQPEKPKNYEKMLEIAEKLSAPFPHVRVDFYNLDGTIVFGELTFFTNAGPVPHEPESFELELGRQFVLPKRNH